MSARKDPRTKRWFFRKQITVNGQSVRLSGVPEDYGQKNTAEGAAEAERLAIARARGEAAAPSTAGMATVPTAPPVPTVEEFARTWLAQAKADNRPITYRHKVTTLRLQVLPRFGKLRLDQITFPLVEAWRLHMLNEEGKLPSTVYRIMTEFRSLLGYAHKSDVLAKLPRWPTQKVSRGRPQFLTFEETAQLIAVAEPLDPWKAMIIVAVRTGLRYGELAGLRWQDVDLDGGKLQVEENFVDGVTGPPKSGKGRVVPLSNDAIAALTAIRHTRGPLVFCGRRGSHIHHGTAVKALNMICDHAGRPRINWHRFRHTFASHLMMRGVSPKAIMDLLGHSKMELTLRYAHLQPETRRDAVMLLDQPPPVPSTRRPPRAVQAGDAAPPPN
ncbi:MAG: site-specific integrase [Myxococcales bacterium]|nr:site-specific integrase [Myxococcales bacterium]